MIAIRKTNDVFPGIGSEQDPSAKKAGQACSKTSRHPGRGGENLNFARTNLRAVADYMGTASLSATVRKDSIWQIL